VCSLIEAAKHSVKFIALWLVIGKTRRPRGANCWK